jgi:hypothetical protein
VEPKQGRLKGQRDLAPVGVGQGSSWRLPQTNQETLFILPSSWCQKLHNNSLLCIRIYKAQEGTGRTVFLHGPSEVSSWGVTSDHSWGMKAINLGLILLIFINQKIWIKVPVARHCSHTCNMSYSGGRDWKDHSSRQAQQKVKETPY